MKDYIETLTTFKLFYNGFEIIHVSCYFDDIHLPTINYDIRLEPYTELVLNNLSDVDDIINDFKEIENLYFLINVYLDGHLWDYELIEKIREKLNKISEFYNFKLEEEWNE